MVAKVPPPASIAGDTSKSNTIEALVFCVLFFAVQIALVVLYTFFFTWGFDRLFPRPPLPARG